MKKTKNFILIDDICSENDGEGIATTSHMLIHIDGVQRKAVVGILASLCRNMKVSPVEILLWQAEHDSSKDKHHTIGMSPEVLRMIAEPRGEDEA